jgi:peptidoglycan/xylan/chitin deacetylase (PgdA/CDA1 family)
MCFLSNNFNVVKLSDLKSQLNKPQSKPLAVVTFDDGYYNNLSVAEPILKYYKIPATIFLVTSTLDKLNYYWWDRVRVYLLNFDHSEKYIEDFRSNLKFLHPIDLEIYVNELTSRNKFPLWATSAYRTINRSDIFKSSDLIEFGSHTSNHEILTTLSHDDVERTLTESYNTIKELTGKDYISLSYPNGNNNSEIRSIAKNIGYDLAVTTCPELVSCNSDIFSMPRIGVGRNMSFNEFKFTVSRSIF